MSQQSLAKNRGKDFERKLVTELNQAGYPTRRVGQFGGKTDVLIDGKFAIQAKKFAESRYPGWMTQELEDLAHEAPLIEPALIIESAPGRGKKSQRLVVIDWSSFLHYLMLMQLQEKPNG